MATQVQIGQAGEAAAVAALKEKGWTITNWNTQAPGSTDIEASSGSKKLLVQVKSSVALDSPAALSGDEERNIKSRATRIGAEAHEARVTLNQSLVATRIDWRKLT
jgi:Holliday junction resolvase-like predicted endonuclease